MAGAYVPVSGRGKNTNLALRSIKERDKNIQASEDAKYNAAVLKKQQPAQGPAKPNQPKQNLLERGLGDVGSFVKGAATDIKNTTVDTAKNIEKTVKGVANTGQVSQNTDQLTRLNQQRHDYTKTLTGEDFQHPDVKKKLAEFSQRYTQLTNQGAALKSSSAATDLQKIDPKKAAFEAGETALNIGTLGVGAPIKAGLSQAGKRVVTLAVARQVAKTAGTKGVENLIKIGGENTAKKLAQESLQAGGQKLLAKTGESAALGAGYGVTQTGKNSDKHTGVKDYLLNAAYGAGLGAVLPLAGAGIKKGVQKLTGTEKIPTVKTQKNEVVQTVNPTTGEKTFYHIPSNNRDSIVNAIDNNRDANGLGGTAGKPVNGEITHVTARSPESMASKGFRDGGVYGAEKPHDDLNAMINRTIDEQSGKYDPGALVRVKNWIGDQVNPFRALAKVDDQYSKLYGIKRQKLDAGNSLEDLARRSATSEREAGALFEKKTPTGQSAKDLVMKYKGDSAAGKEFNNYTNAKFDLEFRAKKGGNNRIQQGIDDNQLQDFVKKYEAKNPNALKDLQTKKHVNDMAVDYMVKSKAISEAEGAQIKGAYKNAVPLERVFPEDLQRPTVNAKNVGSIAKQTVIQRLEGGSDIPLSNSFDTMLNRVYKAVSQGNRAKLAQKLLERHQEGLIKGGKLVIGAGNKETRIATRDQIKEINKGVRYLTKKTQISNRQARRLQTELDQLNKQGLNTSLKATREPNLAGKLVDPGLKTSPTETKSVIKNLITEDPAKLQQIRNKIATREPKLTAKLDEVMNHQARIEANKAAKTDLKDVISEFQDDPTTGKQVISGIVDGQTFKMEVPPELAKSVQGLDQQKLTGVLKAFALVKKPFEITWTGVLNPVFSAMSYAFYDTPMSVINSPQGFKTLAPKAVIESIKSIKSSSNFQRKLAAEGVRPYGGSGASAFFRPNAEVLASQRNLLTKVKYTATHPEVALSHLDVWGGKLANSTRTRIARAAYSDALKVGKKNGLSGAELEDRAMKQAALAYRTIMPDYDTMSNLTRQINSVVPFYAASVAGTRSFGQALRRAPLETSAKALALGIAPTAAITAFSLMQPQGQKFYKDMAKTNHSILDNNLVVVLPGAHKDDSTGEWKGIVKVPLAPEFRAINQTTWRETRKAMGGDGPNGSQIALSLFDAITGGVRTSENPLITTQKILAGQDPRTGQRLVKGNMADLPQNQQAYTSTSGAAKRIAGVLHTSPIQADKLLSEFGVAGGTVKNGGKPVEAIAGNVKSRMTGAFGQRASDSFYSTYTPLKAQRDKASAQVTLLVRQGKIGEARRKAQEFNAKLPGRFAGFNEQYGKSSAYDPNWDSMLNGLMIKTGDNSFKARVAVRK